MKNLNSYFALIIGLLFVVNTSTAQIIYTDVNPDITISTSASYSLDLNNDKKTDFIITGSSPLMSPRKVTIECKNLDAEVLFDPNPSYPSAFSSGQDVDSLQTVWGLAAAATILNTGGTIGNWIGSKNEYLGLRISINKQWYYGWARMDVVLNASSFTIKDYAYNSTPDQGIKTGDMGNVSVKENSTLTDIVVYTYNKTLFIDLKNTITTDGCIRLYNLTGQQVKTYAIDNSTLKINAADINSGVYLLTIQTTDGVFSTKISIR